MKTVRVFFDKVSYMSGETFGVYENILDIKVGNTFTTIILNNGNMANIHNSVVFAMELVEFNE